MEFSEKIKNARTAKNMTQSDLARATGISPRTIQNYELGVRLPKKKETYTLLARALDIDEEALLDENASFVLQARERYGDRAARQAMSMVNDISAMWAGGEMEEEDMDTIMKALQDAYWEAKKNNRKYVNKRFLHDDTHSDNRDP